MNSITKVTADPVYRGDSVVFNCQPVHGSWDHVVTLSAFRRELDGTLVNVYHEQGNVDPAGRAEFTLGGPSANLNTEHLAPFYDWASGPAYVVADFGQWTHKGYEWLAGLSFECPGDHA